MELLFTEQQESLPIGGASDPVGTSAPQTTVLSANNSLYWFPVGSI